LVTASARPSSGPRYATSLKNNEQAASTYLRHR
jgi:hypothetical protein